MEIKRQLTESELQEQYPALYKMQEEIRAAGGECIINWDLLEEIRDVKTFDLTQWFKDRFPGPTGSEKSK